VAIVPERLCANPASSMQRLHEPSRRSGAPQRLQVEAVLVLVLMAWPNLLPAANVDQ
jgi:hypothetical protein